MSFTVNPVISRHIKALESYAACSRRFCKVGKRRGAFPDRVHESAYEAHNTQYPQNARPVITRMRCTTVRKTQSGGCGCEVECPNVRPAELGIMWAVRC